MAKLLLKSLLGLLLWIVVGLSLFFLFLRIAETLDPLFAMFLLGLGSGLCMGLLTAASGR